MKFLIHWGMIADRIFRKNILILGTADHVGEVDAFEWADKRILHLNLNEYKTIILNFEAINLNSLINETYHVKLYTMLKDGNIDVIGHIDINVLINLQHIDHALQSKENTDQTHLFLILGSQNKFNFYLFSNMVLISKLIADKRGFQYSNGIQNKLPDGSDSVALFYEFFNKNNFKVVKESNISMVNANELVEPYFEQFKQFDLVFISNTRHTPLAHSFYNALLSFIIEIHGIDLIVLPHPKLTLPKDVTESVLRNIIGLESDRYIIVPDWVEGYQTQRQSIIEGEIDEIRSQINFLENQIEAKQAEIDLIGEYQRALYTEGELMKNSVFQLLKTMDTNIQSIDKLNSHDFQIETENYIIVIQVNALEDSLLKRKLLRQLNQWVEEVEEKIKFSKRVKGLNIINHQIKEDPKNREALVMDQKVREYIKMHEFCIMSTISLFEFYTQYYERRPKMISYLLDAILNTTGIFNLESINDLANGT